MNKLDTGDRTFDAVRGESSAPTSLGPGDWLGLAATPTFAAMALLTAASAEPDILCMPAQDASPFSGMVVMYLLMSAFHTPPWLKLVVGQRGAARRARANASQGAR